MALLLSHSTADTMSAQRIRATVSEYSWSIIAEAIIRNCQAVSAPVPFATTSRNSQTSGGRVRVGTDS
jgi:hypothetical protein